MNLINPYTVFGFFGLVMVTLALWKPQTARIVFGIFYLIMALVVNLPLVINDPMSFSSAGANALLPVYRWFFTQILPQAPVLLGSMLIVVEISIGLLILSKGGWARLGLLGGLLFCTFITFVGKEELTAPILALAFALLLRRRFDRSLPELLRRAPRTQPQPL